MFVAGIIWSFSTTSVFEVYVRLLGFTVVTSTFFTALPIVMKWVLIGRWKEEEIPIWSMKYLRFWVVKQLVQNNPIVLFKGLPIFNWYLRLLGAKIGKHAVIDTKKVPVCTDLIDIEYNTILRKDTFLLGYRAQAGYIYPGPVTVGKNAFVGEGSVLEINTAMGDDTQLGHTSSLQYNQSVPSGKRYHGSPAEETEVNYSTMETKRCSTLRRFTYSMLQFGMVSLPIPVFLLVLYVFFSEYFEVFADFVARGDVLLIVDDVKAAIIWFTENVSQLLVVSILFVGSLAFFFSALFFSLLVIAALPRVLNLLIAKEKTYVLYGVHYYIFKMIAGLTNSRFFNLTFGDSSYIVWYLNLIGYKASKIVQTGSNFGTDQHHDYPFLCEIGDGTMVSDGLRMMNADITSSSFKLSPVKVREDNFFGNAINYPHNAKMGSNCMMGTKALIPIEGPIRENIGILGSPSFEIPRSVLRDQQFDRYKKPEVMKEQIHKKNIFNLYTMGAFLLSRWALGFLVLMAGYLTTILFGYYGFVPVIVSMLSLPIIVIGYFVLLEWWSLGFKRMSPRFCSILDPDYWRVEHYWKISEPMVIGLFTGTPMKNVISRLVGLRVGKRVFDDGLMPTEKTLAEIGDYCTINDEATVQSHSLEDGVYKSDRISVGNGCTLGVNSFVHYGVTSNQ